jgi:predicted transposase YdaD
MPAPGHKRFDKTLKRIADEEPVGLLECLADLLGLPGKITLINASLSKELIDVVREVDLVWLVQDENGRQWLLHVEFQLRLEEGRIEIGARMAGYVVRLYERERLPITSLVIYLQESGQIPDPPFVIPSGMESSTTLRCDYHVIKLWELPPETVLGRPYPLLWPLAGMMRGMTAETVVGVAQRIAQTPFTQEQKSELIGQLVVLAGVQVTAEAISAAFRRHPMIDDLLSASSVAQAWKEEGRVEGRMEGMRDFARLALEGRFGTLSNEVVQALAAADEATLREVVSHQDETLEQVRVRLKIGRQ